MKNRITIRTYPGGSPATGVPYTIYREIDDLVLKTGFTDANGQFTYDTNLCPGPWRWEAIDNSGEEPQMRTGSTKSYDSAGTYSLYELPYALRALGSGVVTGCLNEMEPTLGTGLTYSVKTGAAVALGIPTTIITPITNQAMVSTTRDATNPKQCWLVLQFEGLGTTEEGKVILTENCSPASSSPVLPGLVQTEARWQLPLATFRLPNTAGSALTQFLDVRNMIGVPNLITTQLAPIARLLDPLASVAVTSTTGVDVVWPADPNPLLLDGVTYDITTEVSLLVKAAATKTISIAPFINTTANRAPFIASAISADYMELSSSYSLVGVVGTGALLDCGTTIRVNGGTGSYLTGTQIVTATPR